MAGRQRSQNQKPLGCTFYLIVFGMLIFNWVSDKANNSSSSEQRASNNRTLSQSEMAVRQIRDESDETLLEKYHLGRLKGIIDSDRGCNIVHIAAELNRYKLLTELIKSGESASARDKGNRTPLHLAMAKKSSESVELLLKAGAELKAATSNGYTILHHAAQYGFYDVAKAALKAGENPSVVAYGGYTPLHYAARNNQLKIAVLLCENGANTDAAIDYGWSPGDLAFSKSPEITNYLQSRNARFSTQTLITEFKLVNGWPFVDQEEITRLPEDNPVFLAISVDSDSQLAELKQQEVELDICNSAKTPALCLAIVNDKFKAASYLLKHTQTPEAVDVNGVNALFYAIESGNESFVREILKRKVDLSHADRSGNTALHYALSRSQNEIASELINQGANIFAENNFSRGMIHVATENSNSLMFAVLISNGCNINQEDIHGNTPLHIAVKNSNLQLVEALLKNGADFSIINNQGKTPLMLAKTAKMQNILKNRFEIEGQNPSERELPAEVHMLPTPAE